MNEKHPLVLVSLTISSDAHYSNIYMQGFFLVVLGTSEIVFIPAAWIHLNRLHRLLLPMLVILPYLFIYTTVTTNSSVITAENHSATMRQYPYDWALFVPGQACRTCRFLKPARSKHCSICKACISKHDHHCIWVNNCIGRGNYGHFIALLSTLSGLLTYGGFLGHMIMTEMLQETTLRRSQGMASRQHWSAGKDWSTYFQLWGRAFSEDVRIGGVTLLAIMTAPLAIGLLIYHIYLIWAGMTTNESSKWADWRDDIADGVVFAGRRTSTAVEKGLVSPEMEPMVAWPIRSDQVLIRVESGLPPSIDNRAEFISAPCSDPMSYGEDWTLVQKLQDVHNVYDLGFWYNLRDILRTR